MALAYVVMGLAILILIFKIVINIKPGGLIAEFGPLIFLVVLALMAMKLGA